MKKTYINPTITTVKVVMHRMIATSGEILEGTTDSPGFEGLAKDGNFFEHEGNTPNSYSIWED